MSYIAARLVRAGRASRKRGAVATGAALALAFGSGVAVARPARAVKRRPPVCQHIAGHTILRRGQVRVFRASGVIYGCLNGSESAWSLWESGVRQNGSLGQVDGRFVAVQSTTSDQYEWDTSLDVVDLRSGGSYSIAGESEPLDGPAAGDPATPGPWPIETYVLGPDGRTARLYDTFIPGAGAYSGTVVSQVLDLIGFHHVDDRLATSAPDGIAPQSLAYDGRTVTWTQDGSPQSASVLEPRHRGGPSRSPSS